MPSAPPPHLLPCVVWRRVLHSRRCGVDIARKEFYKATPSRDTIAASVCDAGQSCVAELPPAEHVADKRVTWAEAGSGLTVCNAGKGEWRQVCWEFKQRPRRSEAVVRALLSSAIYTTCVGTDLLFENEYCRAWDFFICRPAAETRESPTTTSSTTPLSTLPRGGCSAPEPRRGPPGQGMASASRM